MHRGEPFWAACAVALAFALLAAGVTLDLRETRAAVDQRDAALADATRAADEEAAFSEHVTRRIAAVVGAEVAYAGMSIHYTWNESWRAYYDDSADDPHDDPESLRREAARDGMDAVRRAARLLEPLPKWQETADALNGTAHGFEWGRFAVSNNAIATWRDLPAADLGLALEAVGDAIRDGGDIAAAIEDLTAARVRVEGAAEAALRASAKVEDVALLDEEDGHATVRVTFEGRAHTGHWTLRVCIEEPERRCVYPRPWAFQFGGADIILSGNRTLDVVIMDAPEAVTSVSVQLEAWFPWGERVRETFRAPVTS